MNKIIFLRNLGCLLCFGWIAACKTSGDLATEKSGADPAEIVTVGSKSSPEQKTVSTTSHVNEDLAREVEVLKGQLQEQKYLSDQQAKQYEEKIAKLESQINILKASNAAPAAQSADLLWETARKDVGARTYDKATQSLSEFIENFPQDPRVETAFTLRGQSEYSTGNYKAALVSFGQYLDRYPKGKDRPMAWVGQAASLIKMNQKKDAKLFLEQCIFLHPKSREAKLAKKLLKNPKVVPESLFEV